MLQDRDLVTLLQHIAATAEVLGTTLTEGAAALMAEDLAEYPLMASLSALKRVRTEHTGRLTTKAVIDRLDDVMGRLPAAEAWAVAVQAQDERATVVWSSEIAQAWAVARPLIADKVGARMAFVAAYERIVREARERQAMPETLVSIGWDAELRKVAIDAAVAMGRLSSMQALAYVEQAPALPTPGFNPVALLTGNVEVTHEASPEMRARLADLREQLVAANKRDAQAAEARKQATHQAWAERKAQVAEAVRKHQACA